MNKLLLYRFQFLSRLVTEVPGFNDRLDYRELEPRSKQLLMPLLYVTPRETTRSLFLDFAENNQRESRIERSMGTEAHVVELLLEMFADQNTLTIKDLTARFIERFGEDYERKITPRWIGSIARQRLGLKTYKSHGLFIIPEKELKKLTHLAEKFGIDCP